MIIVIVFVLFIVSLLFFGSLPFISIYAERKKEKLFRQLDKEAIKKGLVFCSHESLDDKVIGFDGIHRKLLILERNKKKYISSIISLDEVHHCQLITNEGIFDANNFKKLNRQNNPSVLELQFEFSDHHEPTSIIFNDRLNLPHREFALLKAKAEYWCLLFSKLLIHHVSVRA